MSMHIESWIEAYEAGLERLARDPGGVCVVFPSDPEEDRRFQERRASWAKGKGALSGDGESA